ncbi:MAG: circadian clock protein KaiC [Thermacetogenium sp.]|nr:circadian clock protein KaiC [Thermacetogenium sp.]
MLKIRTGISGFDELFYGGILAGSMVLVEGIPGAGKTTLGIEFIYRGAEDFGENGLILTFEQFPESLYRDACSLGWDLQGLEKENRLRVVCTSPEVVLEPESRFLEQIAGEVRAKRLVVDSVSHFRQAISNPLKLRQAVYAFGNGLRRLGLTSFLLKEQESDDEKLHSFEEFLVDVVVRLHYGARDGLQRRRALEIVKSRGQPHFSGRHSFQIKEGGIHVYSLRPLLKEPQGTPAPERRVKTGIRGLDELLRGGFPEGAGVVVAGEAGTGKSVLGTEYLVKGALCGEKGCYVSLEEPPERIIARSASFSWNLSALIDQNLVQIFYTPFVDVNIDQFIAEIRGLIGRHRIRRLVLDSLPALISGVQDAAALREKLFFLLAYLKSLDCTSLFLYPTVVGQEDRQFGIVQSLVQGSIILKSILFHNRRMRLLELYKMRGTAHATGNHLMEITEDGVQVFPRPGGWQ